MCTYLEQVGSTYYFRRMVPAELRAVIRTKTGKPRSEWKFSLNTKDRAEAKRLLLDHIRATDDEMDAAKATLAKAAGRAPATPQRPPARFAAMERAREDHEDEADKFFQREAEEQDARQEARAHLRKLFSERMRLTTAELEPWEAAIKDLLNERDFDLAVANDRMEAYKRKIDAAKVNGPRMLQEPPKAVTVASPAQPGSGVMLDTTIADLWAAERGVTEKTKDAHVAVARWFYERAGKRSVEQISRKDVLAFKDALVGEGQSPENINVKLSRLRTLLSWAVQNDYAATNAADNVKVKTSGKKARVHFDLPALRRIFGSPVFKEGERPVRGRKEASYWIPLIALFSGARMEEIGQMRVGDVVQEEYPDADGAMVQGWFLNVTDLGEDQKLKNDASKRTVPLHPELERLGLLKYVEGLPTGGRLFPDLKAGAYGRLTAKWGEWFSIYLRNVCGVTDKRMVFHSFRHTFKHHASHVGMIEGVQRQIMGHSPGDVADDYRGGYSLHQLVEGIRLYRIAGLDL
ncbi:MAG TPA: site-specific integrase [Rhizorhapis sp.]|uniref:site-specific integrase n=1 Tax=Rhizorhapis sp. TaxID=1968842 RepID=UPI002B46718D|nr:site-specific integrase [Rhizorhapis sp.]HKR17044.1 site-specific integrase [Rhizorhapis sp.]HKX23575.1 site-specific integrase [Rhizorhapis sp.]